MTSDSFEYLALRWSETPRFEPLWVMPVVISALLSTPHFCLVAELTNPLERRAVRAEQVPVFTDGVRTVINRYACAAFAAELYNVEKRYGRVY